jgi:DNA invertase Pin-like site-specific DNA recombinase
MRIAIYARVSTDDKGQNLNQLQQLRQWCASAGHGLVHEYVDHESGRKGTKDRKQFAALFEDAHKRRFDCVLFWVLDRFTREGMVPTILHLQRLAACGVGFHSYTEAHLATDNELVRNILLALLASLAKVEAQKISERTRAGMARAKAQGKRIGRPGIAPKLRQQIAPANRGRRDPLCRGQGVAYLPTPQPPGGAPRVCTGPSHRDPLQKESE